MTAPVQERTGTKRRTPQGEEPLRGKEKPRLVVSIALTTALGVAWAAEVGVGVGVSLGNLVTGSVGKPLPR
ncbi:hypothetical protein ACWEOE_15755 [Amycolatopsis sp. NPDC004368]